MSESPDSSQRPLRRCLSITISWRRDVIFVRHLCPPRSFVLGQEGDDLVLPAAMLDGRSAPLFEVNRKGAVRLALRAGLGEGSWLELADGTRRSIAVSLSKRGVWVPFDFGARAHLRLGDFEVTLAHERAATAGARYGRPAKRVVLSLLAVSAAVAVLGAAARWGPVPTPAQVEIEQLELARRYLVRAEEARAEEGPTQDADRSGPLDDAEGGTGSRADHAQRSDGASPKLLAQRYAVRGPATDSDPHIARAAALRDAAEFGMIGIVASPTGSEPSSTADPAGAAAAGSTAGAQPGGPQGREVRAPGDALGPTEIRDYGVNPPVDPGTDPVSTFALDVDTGSFTMTRRALREGGYPAPASVRTEEFLNYFEYDYQTPAAQEVDSPLAVHIDGAPSPFDQGHHLVRIGLQAKQLTGAERKPVHLVYLVDTSGSMQSADKLGLVKRSLRMLTQVLRPSDTVALCTYAGSVREVLPPVPAKQRQRILEAIDDLSASGSTAMESGIDLAYRLAERTLVAGEINRVIVLSDGDANVGASSHEQILETIKGYREQGITLSTVGFGVGNYRDQMMERLADEGNGNYTYIDNAAQARRVFIKQVDGLLQVVARDVKVQVQFNPRFVRSYRLLGYENRDVADADFRDDAVDGGEVGAGHSVTALYDVVSEPAYRDRYATSWLTVRVRHLPPGKGGSAVERTFEPNEGAIASSFEDASVDYRFAVAVTGFAEVLRHSAYAGSWSLEDVEHIARGAQQDSADRAELVELINRARARQPS